MSTIETDWVAEIGAPACESIRDLLAALECDYDRLEELAERETGKTDSLTAAESAEYRDLASRLASEDDRNQLTADEQSRYDDLAARATLGDDDPLSEEERAELADLRTAAGDCESEDDARERIDEDPLDIEIRGYRDRDSGEWFADEFTILLTTGGPAVRIVGDLNRGQPESPRLQVQDWGKPWTEYLAADRDALQAYCDCFCFE